MVMKEVFEKVDFEKSAVDNKSMENYPACIEFKEEKKKSKGELK